MPLSKYQAGFTLIEIVLTIVLLSFSAMIMIPIVQGLATVTTPVQRQQAVALGQGLMDEILCKRWDENSPVGGAPIITTETTASVTRGDPATVLPPSPVATVIGVDGVEVRAGFDDVDDYDGFNETDYFNDQTGGNPVHLVNFSRAVTVRYISSTTIDITAVNPAGTTSAGSATDSKRVVITVTTPTGETFDFVALACNF